jgi:DNA-directed RNA polymerase omega subunit
MARVTVEDCLEKIPNRFALTILGSRRARALSEGKGTAQVKSSNKVGVVALREIAKGLVRYDENIEETVQAFIDEQRAQLMAGSSTDATFIDAATFTASEDDEEEEDDDVKELSTDPDKLIEEEEAGEEEEEEEEVEAEEEEPLADDEELADDVDPAVLEDLDDLGEEEDEDDEPEEEEEAIVEED